MFPIPEGMHKRIHFAFVGWPIGLRGGQLLGGAGDQSEASRGVVLGQGGANGRQRGVEMYDKGLGRIRKGQFSGPNKGLLELSEGVLLG